MSNWLTGIIVILMIIILVDGFRRTAAARRNRIRVSPSLKKRTKQVEEPEVVVRPENFTSELPNGGARVIGARDSLHTPLPTRKAASPKIHPKEAREARRRAEAAKRTPEQTQLNLNESVPILMESVEAQPMVQSAASVNENLERIEPTFTEPTFTESSFTESTFTEPAFSANTDEDLDDDHHEEEYDEEEDEEEYDEEIDQEAIAQAEAKNTSSSAPHTEPEEVFIINVMAFKDEMFAGNDLLDAVLKCGLRYGNMDIFHRYSDAKGEGVLLFSMANMVKPGTFDLDAMDTFETPGVSLFMTLPIDADSMKTFDLMVGAANSLVDALDGELKDEQRSAMTRQTIEHCRQRISEFERKKLFRRPRQ
jgi:cell division protein ZipA